MLRPLLTCKLVSAANCAVLSALRLSDGRLDSCVVGIAAICAVVKPATSVVMLISGKSKGLKVNAEQLTGVLTRRPSHVCNSIFFN